MTSDAQSAKPVIVLGAGGHAKVIIDTLRLMGREIVGVTDPSIRDADEYFGLTVLGDDSVLEKFSPRQYLLANGVGALPGDASRYELERVLSNRGYRFSRVIHPSAIIASDAEIADGAQIMAGVIIQPGVRIGASCIINTGAKIDHDCEIQDNCHLAPGVTLCGEVKVGKSTHIGAGATVIQCISIGRDCVIAAGSTVYGDIGDSSRYLPGKA
jgi:UDP-perosamine 4-acetyltransferase